ncbi:MAG: peptidylprolyl isomerase, partial [Bacteroidales bacterium]
SFGYHIIRVEDLRPSKGKIKVAHIMKAAPPGADDQTINKARAAIDSIYSRLKAGESFKTLAKNLSDHKESAARGGEMNWFGAGEIIPDFSEAAFSIRDTGEYTMPVRTVYGFHIIKLLDRKPPDTFDEAKPYLESKMNQSNINALGKKSLVDKLKKEYGFSVNQSVREWFIANTDSLIFRGKSNYISKNMPPHDIYSFAGRHFSAREFGAYLDEKGRMAAVSDPTGFIDKSVESSASEEIIKYEDSMLESKYPDFRYLMNEFHDGILLFDVSSKEVWNRVMDDSTGLQDYYQKNKINYLSRDSAAGRVYSEPPPFGDVQAEMISGYQDWLTAEWVRKLKEKYQVAINSRAFKEVKKRLDNE